MSLVTPTFEACAHEFTSLAPSVACAKFAVSKVLSTGIVAGAVMVKLPQIQRILSKRSVGGLRVAMFATEVASGTIAIAYFARAGVALVAYAELFFILIQNLIILGLMKAYGGVPGGTFAVGAVAYVAGAAALALGVVPDGALSTLYNCTTALIVYGRAPQIVANAFARSTGEMSFATQVLLTAGGAARVFTTTQEGGSASMLFQIILSASMNAVLLSQMFIYAQKHSSKPRSVKRTKAS